MAKCHLSGTFNVVTQASPTVGNTHCVYSKQMEAPILNELSVLEKKLKGESLSDSDIKTLWKLLEKLEGKLEKFWAYRICIIKTEGCTESFADVSDSRSYYRGPIKLYGHSKIFGNQTSLVVASTSTSKNDPNQTVIENNKDASKPNVQIFEVSSQMSATNRIRKELSVAQSHS